MASSLTTFFEANLCRPSRNDSASPRMPCGCSNLGASHVCIWFCLKDAAWNFLPQTRSRKSVLQLSGSLLGNKRTRFASNRCTVRGRKPFDRRRFDGVILLLREGTEPGRGDEFFWQREPRSDQVRLIRGVRSSSLSRSARPFIERMEEAVMKYEIKSNCTPRMRRVPQRPRGSYAPANLLTW
jgi:hypothetical protein